MAKLSQEELLKAVEEMTVLELSEFVKKLEEKFGVTAAPAVAVAQTAPAMAGGAGTGEAAQDKTEFTVVLKEAGANKIGAIKAVREILPNLGLQDAKKLVESAPKEVLENATKEAAEEAKKKLESAGAKVELK